MNLGIVLTALLIAAIHINALGRQFEQTLDAKTLEKAGLGFPLSAAFLHLPKISTATFSSQCTTSNFTLKIYPKSTSERLSTSLKMKFEKNEPAFEECLRGSTCQRLTAEKVEDKKSARNKIFILDGQSSKYTVLFNALAPSDNDREVVCSSFATNILGQKRAILTAPESLWILNYGSKIVFFDATTNAPWFEAQLPQGVRMGKNHTAVADTQGRFFVYDKTTSLMVHPLLDRAFIIAENKLFTTNWGLGSISYRDEWSSRSIERLAGELEVSSRIELNVFMNGVVSGTKLISWESIAQLLTEKPFRVVNLHGRLVAAHEAITTAGTNLMMALRVADNSLTLATILEGHTQPIIIDEGLNSDSRARDFDFIILENQLYRFTAHGLYKVSKNSENPTILNAHLGRLANERHLLTSRVTGNGECTLNLWSNKKEFFRLFDAALTNLPCRRTDGLSVSPWSFSATKSKSNVKLEAITSSID